MKISVVIPSYNQALFLPESIDSVLKQTLNPHEIIVVDDGSTDNTREVIARYPATTYIYQNNSGPSAARNNGVDRATGDWIALLDADDVWLPRKLEIQAARIKDEGLCYCATTRFFSDGRTEDAETFPCKAAPEALKRRNFIDPSSVLVRRDLMLSVGGFDPNMRAAEDWELWLKLLRVCKFVDVPERLLRYRVTSNSASADPEIHLKSMERIVAAGTADLAPARRVIESRRMRSVRYSMISIKYREKGDYGNALRFALRGLRQWPSPFYDRAFKIALLELGRKLFGKPNGLTKAR